MVGSKSVMYGGEQEHDVDVLTQKTLKVRSRI